MRKWFTLLAGLLFWATQAFGAEKVEPYFYPFVNPFEATVMELPPFYQAILPETVPTRIFKLRVFPERAVPDLFWYEDGLVCSLVYQKRKAPLIFVVAGTGARFNSPKMLNLQRALYQAGFHVISITSPTHMNFVVNASRTGVPGNLTEDARDLYRVMELAWEKVRDRIEVSDFGLAGYSLGGIQSAYVSQLDEERRLFDFKRVLLINPPANLYNSVSLLDQLLAENIPGGPENFNAWFGSVLEKLAMLEKELGYVELTGEYLYKVYKRFPPREDFLAALIGLSFRMDSANMIFSSDVMNGGGYIAPAGARLTASTDLTPFAMVAYRTTFGDYFHEYFFPFFRRGEPGLTEEALIERMSLHHIEAYLRSAEKIGLIHNEDDIIMSPGEVDYLGEVFGERARIFPTGGHCGNMNHPDVVRFIVDFLAGKEG